MMSDAGDSEHESRAASVKEQIPPNTDSPPKDETPVQHERKPMPGNQNYGTFYFSGWLESQSYDKNSFSSYTFLLEGSLGLPYYSSLNQAP